MKKDLYGHDSVGMTLSEYSVKAFGIGKYVAQNDGVAVGLQDYTYGPGVIGSFKFNKGYKNLLALTDLKTQECVGALLSSGFCPPSFPVYWNLVGYFSLGQKRSVLQKGCYSVASSWGWRVRVTHKPHMVCVVSPWEGSTMFHCRFKPHNW